MFRSYCKIAFAAAVFAVLILNVVSFGASFVQEYKSGIIWTEPPVVDPGPAPDQPGPVPSDAIVLFDGTDLSQWNNGDKWEIEDGYAISSRSGISTKQSFGDCQLHLEFASPNKVKGNGQGRGNSGVYMMGQYEIQVLDSFDNKTYFDGQCGAVYKQQPPTVNACRSPGEWQSYDIIFEAPVFDDDGAVVKKAVVTVLHNGVVIHHHLELQGSTSYTEAARYRKHGDRLPISIQFHGNPVRFRNIWIRENIQPVVGKPPKAKPLEPKKEDKTGSK